MACYTTLRDRISRSFARDPDLAANAGRKGGANVPKAKRSFSADNQLAMDAGRKGGLVASARRQKAAEDQQV